MEFLEFLMLTAAMLLLIFKPEKEKEALQKYPEQSFAQKFGLCNR